MLLTFKWLAGWLAALIGLRSLPCKSAFYFIATNSHDINNLLPGIQSYLISLCALMKRGTEEEKDNKQPSNKVAQRVLTNRCWAEN